MRAVQFTAYGPPEDAKLVELPDPTPGPGQILVRMRATSVNPVDWKMISGQYHPVISASFPLIPGFDVAGDVVALGPGVTGWAVGDRAFARLDGTAQGACAELVPVNLTVAARIPDGLDDPAAAAMPLAGLTALQGLRDRGGMALADSGARVLVVGASGGVGHYAVQIARAAGAHVTGVCSGRNAALVRSLGAHEVIDYTREDGVGRCAPYDIVLDCVGSQSFWSFRPHMTPKGRFVTAFPAAWGTRVGLLTAWAVPGPSCQFVRLQTNAADLRLLAGLAAKGQLRSVIDRVFPFEELAAAHRASMAGRAVGKIIVLGPPDR